MSGRLDGRVVLVTGASSGLGIRFAQVAAAAGAALIVGARRPDRVEALAEAIRRDGGRALAVPLDVTDEASVEAALDRAIAAFGRLDGVVANAGITADARATELPIEDFDRVFATNVRGTFLTARCAARRMQAAGEAMAGRIVLISSITARMRTSGLAAYSASKAAVTHMGGLLAKEWARTGPAVNILSPGYMASDLAGDWFESEAGRRQMARWPRRRLVPPDGLDAMLIYLLSDDSAGVTGGDFTVDDGQSL